MRRETEVSDGDHMLTDERPAPTPRSGEALGEEGFGNATTTSNSCQVTEPGRAPQGNRSAAPGGPEGAQRSARRPPDVEERATEANVVLSKAAAIARRDIAALRTALRAELPERLRNIPAELKAIKAWLVWRTTKFTDLKAGKFNKIPVYPQSGRNRSGAQGSPEDRASLGTYEEAVAAFERDQTIAGIGFACLPEHGVVALDVDKCVEGGVLPPKVAALTESTYCEISVSGTGARAFWLGTARGGKNNRAGFELFHETGFVTVSGQQVENPYSIVGDRLPSLSDQLRADVELACTPTSRAAAAAAPAGVGEPPAQRPPSKQPTVVDDQTKADLRSALTALNFDDRAEWVAVAHGLHELGAIGLSLWLEWSQLSDKFDPDDAKRVWASIRVADRTGYQAVFAKAQRRGWLNPAARLNRIATIDDFSSAAYGPAGVVSRWAAAQLPHDQENASTAPGEGLLPIDLLKPMTAPPLDPADVPSVLGKFAETQASATGFDVSILLAAGIGAACAALSDGVRLRLPQAPNWNESARLWLTIIGGPGSGKSPGSRAALATIEKLHDDAVTKWELTREPSKKDEIEEPPPALYVSDATTEALCDVLKANPRGVLYFTDEFEAWLSAHDAYRGNGGGKDRGEWLRLYDGGRHQVNRVKRGAVYVPNWGVSLLSATTPAALRKLAPKLPDDGLLQRFLLVIADNIREPVPVEDAGAPARAWDAALRRLYAMTDRTISLSPKAETVFKSECAELRRLVSAYEDTYPSFASHAAKRTGMLARLTLVFHVLGSENPGTEISEETMAMAVRFMRRQERHALAVYGSMLGVDSGVTLAKDIARSILASNLQSFNRRDLSNHCKSFHNADKRGKEAALTYLADCSWITTSAAYIAYGTRWTVNPKVHELFAEQGEEARQRRELIKKRVLGESE